MSFRSAPLGFLTATLALCGCTGLYIPYDDDPPSADAEPVVVPITAQLVTRQAGAQRPRGQERGAGQNSAGPYQYRIGVGDVLDLRIPSLATFGAPVPAQAAVAAQPAAEAGYVVAADGTIAVPFVGPVKVAGSTVREAQDQVVEGLRRFIKGPQVNVSVARFRSQKVLVGGQVPKPGFLPVTDVPLTLIGALSAAGSTPQLRGDLMARPVGAQAQAQALIESPDYSRVELTRKGARFVFDVHALLRNGDLADDILLADGDAVYVPPVNREYVFVLGEVQQPQVLEIAIGRSSLAEVLLVSGGLDQQTSNAERVYVIRGQLDKPEVFQLNANAPDALLLADAFTIQPRDVVYVAEANISRWNRFLSQLVPTIQTLLTGGVFANTAGQ